MTLENPYGQIVEQIFHSKYKTGAREVPFERSDIESAARKLKIPLPKNLGDVVYSFRYRFSLPQSIAQFAPPGLSWVIRPAGRSRYSFVLAAVTGITPNPKLAETRVPNATPGVIELYALTDEQALLAKLRYNRLVDIFTGVTCYSLQSHLRTTVKGVGQLETDELYVGIDRRGAHYIFPVQAKGGRDKLSIVQIEQDVAMCAVKFPSLICRPIAAQFMGDDPIALFAFEVNKQEVAITVEKHYRLVPPAELTEEEIQAYQARPLD